jgi:hypothetical protein
MQDPPGGPNPSDPQIPSARPSNPTSPFPPPMEPSAQVEVVGVEGELKQVALDTIKTRPNFAYTIGEVKQDVQRVFNTGWFRECIPEAVDTRDGVKLVIKAS